MRLNLKESKITSALITIFIIILLIFSGPASAVGVTITSLPPSIVQGQDLTLTFNVDLNPGERIPINSYNITVYNSTWSQTFLVYPGGGVGDNVTLNTAGSDYNNFGYGYGYRWGYYDLQGDNYTFGYGYGYNYTAPGFETFNVTLNLSAFNLALGNYSVNITIDTGDQNQIYSSPVYNFSIVSPPPPPPPPPPSYGDAYVIQPLKPSATIIANSIDKALAEEFFGFLRNEGIEISIVNASQFESVKTGKFIIILGGPDAYEGIGDIVKQLIDENEQQFLRIKGNRRMYTLTNKYATGQVIHILAGSDRNETRKAHIENKQSVAVKIKE